MVLQDNLSQALPAYFDASDLSIDAFDALCSQETRAEDYPGAIAVEQNIPIFSGDELRNMDRDAVLRTLNIALRGPGVLAIKRGYTDTAVIDRMTEVFRAIVDDEKSDDAKGDHFGSNERIWNAIQKTFLRAPGVSVDYYANPLLALACEAWLGPSYRITAQMNNVKPGNKAQSVHRDYHLGFQSTDVVSQFPAHTQVMSQYLTLQGAIAHVDMPLEMGPTLLLPYSHQYQPGYIAYTRPEFAEYFAGKRSQIPFEKGDMVFFSPALFHGAGNNTTENDRLANLVQISSAFGRTMETLDNRAMTEAAYPVLLERVKAGTIDETAVDNAIATVADGYSFPTNLDTDPPIGGNAPETEQALVRRALDARMSLNDLRAELDARTAKRRA
ncbi:MAG: phytanoyl-CoA dioxygenase family protein [Chloroflexota bacterium]